MLAANEIFSFGTGAGILWVMLVICDFSCSRDGYNRSCEDIASTSRTWPLFIG